MGLILTDIDDLVIMLPRVDIDRGRYLEEARMSQAIDPVTQHHIDQAADRFRRNSLESSRGRRSPATAGSQDLLGEAATNVYVPVLVHRFTRERLKALAQAEGRITKEQPEVLFVCVQNAGRTRWRPVSSSCRSRGRIHVRSAGSLPAGEVDPVAAEALEGSAST